MGDLGIDTAVTKVGEGRYTATLSDEWAIWGPMGGYIASVALRAAGAESPFARPASFTCHYLGVATFDTVDIEVTTLRSARTALSQRVEITQGGKRMLEATVWSVGEVEFDDPWVDACRSVVLIDVQSWPAANRPHVDHSFYAPSLDLYVSFNDPRPASEWLLVDGHGPIAKDGLMGWTGRLWSDDGRLVASGGGQLLCRHLPGS